jgi:hypothetical protein
MGRALPMRIVMVLIEDRVFVHFGRLLIRTAPLLLLAACATPEARLRTGLTDAGLPPALSQCMAREMAPRLSLRQLLRLRDLSRVGERDPRRADIDGYLHRVRALGDGGIWSVASMAAAHCALDW